MIFSILVHMIRPCVEGYPQKHRKSC